MPECVALGLGALRDRARPKRGRDRSPSRVSLVRRSMKAPVCRCANSGLNHTWSNSSYSGGWPDSLKRCVQRLLGGGVSP